MDYVVQGLSDKDIGVALGIATRTVVTHVRAVQARLQVVGKGRQTLIAAYLATRET
jgi:DNA-binding CsgD family transcriptional regulator